MTMAYPEIPRRGERGDNPLFCGKNLLFGKFLAENCMKMKEIEWTRGHAYFAPFMIGCGEESWPIRIQLGIHVG